MTHPPSPSLTRAHSRLSGGPGMGVGGIRDTVFPAYGPGQETSPAFLGGPGCSVHLALAHLNPPLPPQTTDLETTACLVFVGRGG